MDTNLPPRRKKARSDLIHLRSLLSVLPGTNSGKVTAAWGEIESVLARGHRRFGRLQNWMDWRSRTPILCLCLVTTAASAAFDIRAATDGGTDNRRPRAAGCVAARSV
jgi:hypothetical protein